MTTIDITAGLRAVALDAAAQVAQGAAVAEQAGEPCYVTKDFRLSGSQPAAVAEQCGWLDYSPINNTDYAREFDGPHGHWYRLTWSGLAALAASEQYRSLARHICAQIAERCRQLTDMQQGVSYQVPGMPSVPVTMRRLEDVRRAGGWTD